MSIEYDEYIKMHKKCVEHGFHWLMAKLSMESLYTIFPSLEQPNVYAQLCSNIENHDASKLSTIEYDAYDRYFYSEQTNDVKIMFDYAWLHHIHNNPHHWQHWLLKEDDSKKVDTNTIKVKALDIPDVYIVEMICDWWSFSWKNYIFTHDKKDLYEVFDWYSSHKDGIVMHDNTIRRVENVLNLIHNKLDEDDFSIEVVSDNWKFIS